MPPPSPAPVAAPASCAPDDDAADAHPLDGLERWASRRPGALRFAFLPDDDPSSRAPTQRLTAASLARDASRPRASRSSAPSRRRRPRGPRPRPPHVRARSRSSARPSSSCSPRASTTSPRFSPRSRRARARCRRTPGPGRARSEAQSAARTPRRRRRRRGRDARAHHAGVPRGAPSREGEGRRRRRARRRVASALASSRSVRSRGRSFGASRGRRPPAPRDATRALARRGRRGRVGGRSGRDPGVRARGFVVFFRGRARRKKENAAGAKIPKERKRARALGSRGVRAVHLGVDVRA